MILLLIFLIIGTLLINSLHKYHKTTLTEKFVQEKIFATSLLEYEEEPKKKIEDSTKPHVPTSKSCDCPVTDFTTLSVDLIKSDKTPNVVFRNKVKMNKAHINDLYIHGQQLMSYDEEAKKLTIG